MNKGFTLVIPLYNKVNAIRTTLDSVLKNHGTYPFKCIIVDDDSTDGSSVVAEEYDMKYPDIFMYIKKKHKGGHNPAYARNLGIKLAETEYIGFLDADDELCSGFIDRGCNFLDEHPEYTMYGNGHKVRNEDGSVEEWNYWQDNIYGLIDYMNGGGSLVCFCANIFRTELVKNNLFPDMLAEDSLFILKYVYRNPKIYLDTNYTESFIYNKMYSEVNPWLEDRHYIIDALIKVIPDIKYEFLVNENNQVLYREKQQ